MRCGRSATEEPDQLIDQADRALYAAKDGSRSQIVVYAAQADQGVEG